MPSFGDIDFRLLLANSSNDLTSNFLYRHHPKQAISLRHSCVNKTRSDICYGYATTVSESLFAYCFHIINLVSFCCAIGWCSQFASQSSSRSYSYKMTITLLFKNAIQSINNICPTYNISINGKTLNRIVKRGINITNTCTHNSKVKMTKLF